MVKLADRHYSFTYMRMDKNEKIKIINTSKEDTSFVFWLFEQAIGLQGKNGYKVWSDIDKIGLEHDIEKGLQYKILKDKNILCVFSIQYNDPFIWRARDLNEAIYLHRIVVNPMFKGQRQFEKVLHWAKQFARLNNQEYIRMDTWAENAKIIDYYKSFGFIFIENYQTPDILELPIQNRNIHVALLEMKLNDTFNRGENSNFATLPS